MTSYINCASNSYEYFLSCYVYMYLELYVLSCSVVSDSVAGLPGSSVHGDSPGKNTGVGCYALFQKNFPAQRSNPGLPHCRRIHYCLSHQGSPAITWTCIFYLQPTSFHPFLGGPGPAEAHPPSQPHSPLLHWVWEAWPFPFFLFCFLSSSRIFLSAP